MSTSARVVTAEAEASCRFAAKRAAARHARHWLEPLLASWGLQRHAPDVLVVLSELVTNAVFHGDGDGDVDVRVHCSAGTLRLEVGDLGTGSVIVRCPPPDTVGGRGMLIVEHICRSWGVDGRQHGKIVWAELAVS